MARPMTLEGVALADVEVESTAASPLTFSELYEREFLPLVRLSVLMVGRADVARDIVQDAFVRLHVKWPTVRDPLAYVRRSVVNGCRSQRRWERRRRADDALLDVTVDLGVDHTLAALQALPHRARAAVVMKFYEGRTEQEIADVLGCRPGSVGPMVHRALATLREALT